MRLFAVTVCHMRPEIISYSLTRARLTAGARPETWVLVDNCWPVDPVATSREIAYQANLSGYVYTKAEKNEGGIAGFHLGIKQLPALSDDDLVLGYDPDSNPVTPGWLNAMVAVMEGDKALTHLSLLHNHIVDRQWVKRTVAGYNLVSLPHPEMFNVTIWRGKFLRAGSVQQGQPFYGFVETATKGNHAYLYDYREDQNAVPHDPRYNAWKGLHAGGKYTGNFDQYVLENPT